MVEKQHALTGASGAHKWLKCPGSIALEVKAREAGQLVEKDSFEANEGTLAHDWTEKLLTMGDAGILGCTDMEMVKAAYGMKNLIDEIRNKVGGFDWEAVEHPIKLNDNIYGTADFAALYKKDGETKALIVDLKYGVGKIVKAENNPQIACYAVALRKTLGVEISSATVIIYQPRVNDNEGAIKSTILTDMELNDWEKKLVKGSERAYDILEGREDPEYMRGDWCGFCKVQALCPCAADGAESTGLVKLKREVKLPELEALSPEQMSMLYKHKKDITSFLNKLEDYMLARASSGFKFKGWKLSQKRANRRLQPDREFVVAGLKSLGLTDKDIFDEAPIKGIGKLEAVAGKGNIDDLLYRPEGSICLVPDDDDDFEELVVEDVNSKKAVDVF